MAQKNAENIVIDVSAVDGCYNSAFISASMSFI
jgi:hypothetical protein